MQQYLPIKLGLRKDPEFCDRCALIALIVKMNFDLDEISEDMLDNLNRLIDMIESNPEDFSSEVPVAVFQDEYPLLDDEMGEEEFLDEHIMTHDLEAGAYEFYPVRSAFDSDIE